MVAADRALATTHVHVLRMCVGQHPRGAWRQHDGSTTPLGQGSHLAGKAPRATTRLDHNPWPGLDQCRSLHQAGVVCYRQLWQLQALGQGGQVQSLNHLRLGIDGQHHEKRARFIGVVHALCATTQSISQRLGGMQYIRLAHQGRHLAVQALQRLGDLLHVVALAVRGLITVDVIKPNAIAGCSQRARHGLQPAWANRCHHRASFTIGPSKRSAGVCHLHFIAEVIDLRHTTGGVDTQHFSQVCGAMPKDGQVLGDALPQQSEHQSFGQGDAQTAWQQALVECHLQSACTRDSLGTKLLTGKAGERDHRQINGLVHIHS